MAGPVLIMPAAGRGKRMGGERNKPYLLLAGKPVLAHTLQVFVELGVFSRIIPVIAPGEEEYFKKWILLPFFSNINNIYPVFGGEERQSSVFNALEILHREGISKDTIICIHDGVRPLVRGELILNVLRETADCGAAIAGVPVKDTVKIVDSEGAVQSTPPRERLILAQTPQCFRFSIIWEAHCLARDEGFWGSDDAVLVERTGIPVRVVPGSYDNIKLTTPHDLKIAEMLYSYFPGKRIEEDEDNLDFFLGRRVFGC
ncbi:MAG: 2-C-methyl-D-erythritol 4-phosphate cytidylyltransferase [Firmicutes bacterium]|nr:2-C-methyl-D-erythritol 4-phosphate cytidylyltransferase [Bacillota bacterium]